MTHEPVRVGLVGCGMISATYLANLDADPRVRVVACADVDTERARSRASEFGIPRVLATDELLSDPEVEVVANLTWPSAHAAVTLSALEAGKHVFSEKPLATELEDGARVLAAARRLGLRLGCAPDTFLGDGMQEVRRRLDDGAIGTPLGAGGWCFFAHPATVHAAPQFLYAQGAGPLYDIAPYVVTALVALLGPVARVAGVSRDVSSEQVIGVGPDAGQRFPVTVPTWTMAMLELESGPTAQLLTTWEVAGAEPWQFDDPAPMQLWGSDGVMWPPDPNSHNRSLRVRNASDGEVRVLTAAHANTEADRDHRGLGLIEMAHALRAGEPHRCSAELAYHVLEVIVAIERSAREARHVEVDSTCRRPAPMPELLHTAATTNSDARRQHA